MNVNLFKHPWPQGHHAMADTPVAMTASLNDYNSASFSVIVFDNSSGGTLSLTGLKAEGMVQGMTRWLANRGTSAIGISAESASSSALNRFAWASEIPVAGRVLAYYNGSRWEVLN